MQVGAHEGGGEGPPGSCAGDGHRRQQTCTVGFTLADEACFSASFVMLARACPSTRSGALHVQPEAVAACTGPVPLARMTGSVLRESRSMAEAERRRFGVREQRTCTDRGQSTRRMQSCVPRPLHASSLACTSSRRKGPGRDRTLACCSCNCSRAGDGSRGQHAAPLDVVAL